MEWTNVGGLGPGLKRFQMPCQRVRLSSEDRDMSKCATFQETHSGSHMGKTEALVTENNTARFKG